MPSTTTVNDLIVDALRDCGAFGIGLSPPGDAVSKALRRLNGMLSQWNRKRWLIYQLLDLSVAGTGAQSYSFGPTGQIVLDPRPDKLEAAYMRQLVNSIPNQVDYPLNVISSREQYSLIALKKLTTWTQWVFYDPGLPNGTLYPWPLLQPNYELHVIVKQVLSRYATPQVLVGLPDEYEEAIYFNLCVRLSALYRLAPNPVHVALAKDGLNLIRGANTALTNLRMPRALRRSGSRYNIYSDDN